MGPPRRWAAACRPSSRPGRPLRTTPSVLSVIRGGFSIELADPLPGGVIRLAPPPTHASPHESGHSGGSTHAMYTGGHGKSRRSSSALPLPRLSCSQALGEKFRLILNLKRINLHISPSHFRMETLKSILPPAQTRGLDCVHRPKGRLPSRPNRSRIKGHSRLCSSRKYVPLQGATVRPKARTTPVHKTHSVRGSLPQAAGPASVLLPGRLASGGRVLGTAVPPAALPTMDSAGPGVYSKLGEVGAYTFTAPDLPRSCHRSTPPAGAAEPGQGEHDHGGRTTPAPPPAGPGQGVAPILGYLASLVDVLPDCRLHMRPLQLHLLRHYRPSVDSLTRLVPLPPVHPPASHAVVAAEISDYGQPPAGAPALYHGDHRCLPAGMGWSLPGQYGLWGLAPYGHARSHQFVGVPSCPPLTLLLFAPATPAHSAHTHGQFHCGGLYKQAGGGTHSTRLNALAAQLWTWCRREGIFPMASHITPARTTS